MTMSSCQSMATRLRSAATATFVFHEQTSRQKVRRHRLCLVQVTPRRSPIIVLPIRAWWRLRRLMTMSILCCYRRLAAGDHATRRCRQRYSKSHCLGASYASRRSRRRERCRRRHEHAVSTARNCSLCRRIVVECVRMHRTTVQCVLSARRACVPRVPCSITARPTTMETTDQSAEQASRRLPDPVRRRIVVGVVSGCCWRCCRWYYRASGATPR